jgi:TonB family protein
MRRLHLTIPFFLIAAPTSISPNARPVRLDWGNLNIVMMADSSRGTLIWAASRGDAKGRTKERDFVAYVEPADAHAWTQALRQFLALRLTAADTGTFRASPVLRSRTGDWIYFVRLKRAGRWTDERFIVLQGVSRSEERQLLIEAREQNAIEFLETLESVNIQALGMPPSPRADSIPIANPADTGSCPVVEHNPPRVRYPDFYREDGKDGDVWMSFVVTAAGTVDSSSIHVLLSDGEGFESNVRSAVARTRFTPGRRNGVPISMRVFQQFTFRIVR